MLVVRFTARIRHNTAGEFRIQLMQEGSTGAKDDGAISVSLLAVVTRGRRPRAPLPQRVLLFDIKAVDTGGELVLHSSRT